MSAPAALDLIAELKLRAWARQNYTSATERPIDLHPVALDEMERKDRELSLADAWERIPGIVPLMPDAGDLQHSLHAAHACVAHPHFLNSSIRDELLLTIPAL